MIPRLYHLDYCANGPRCMVLRAYNLGEALQQFQILFEAGHIPYVPDTMEVPPDYRGIVSVEPYPPYREREVSVGAADDEWKAAYSELRASHASGDEPAPNMQQRTMSREDLKPTSAASALNDALNNEEAKPA